jgi:hypothetical protein
VFHLQKMAPKNKRCSRPAATYIFAHGQPICITLKDYIGLCIFQNLHPDLFIDADTARLPPDSDSIRFGMEQANAFNFVFDNYKQELTAILQSVDSSMMAQYALLSSFDYASRTASLARLDKNQLYVRGNFILVCQGLNLE